MRKPSDTTCWILFLLLLIVPASISDAWVLRAQTKCTGHIFTQTADRRCLRMRRGR